MNARDIYPYYLSYSSICIDTRKIEPGSIFFCLKGTQTNGNQFAKEALAKGASYVVMDDPDFLVQDMPRHKVFLVEDSLETLQELAKIHRSKLKIPIIGITGSNGKTTTKEIIRAVLETNFEVFATEGNMNNHIGVPLSLLSIHPQHEIAVIEMGANHQLEIAFLCSMAQPNYGLITNIGKAHLEGFGGVEGIVKGKKELFDFLQNHQGLAFVYTGDHRLLEISQGLKKKYYYGNNGYESIVGRITSEFPFLTITWKENAPGMKEVCAQSHLTGAYNLPNLLAGIALGTYFGLTSEQISQGIESYHPNNNRSQIKKTGNNELILDYYNANPDSMKGALENFTHYPSPLKLAILGDMFELGVESSAEHAHILCLLDQIPMEAKLVIGPEFYTLKKQYPNIEFAKDIDEARDILSKKNWKDFTVLLKGSRGMKLENLLPFFDS